MTDLVVITTVTAPNRKFRSQIPESHRTNLDTRIQWLWNQRFGTVQTVWRDTPDVLDKTAATLILQAIMGKDLSSIELVLKRLEGGSLMDEQNADRPVEPMRV